MTDKRIASYIFYVSHYIFQKHRKSLIEFFSQMKTETDKNIDIHNYVWDKYNNLKQEAP